MILIYLDVSSPNSSSIQQSRNQTTSLTSLHMHLNNLLNNTLAASTKRSYTSAFNHYIDFSKAHNLQEAPIIEYNLLLFITNLSLHSSFSNIKVHLAAIKHFLTCYGFQQTFPPMPRLYMLTRAIKRQNNNKKPPRTPITITTLMQLKTFLIQSDYKYQVQLMLWAAFTTAFFGFLRASEFTAPTINTFDEKTTLLLTDSDIARSQIHIHIKTSKTDPFRQGCTIKLAITGNNICPVTALKQFIPLHPTKHGPLFTYIDGSYLTRHRINTILKVAIPSSAQPTSSHSFRIGAATTAAAAGFPRWLIQKLGRWNSDSFRTYIQIPNETIDHVAKALTRNPIILNIWDPDLV